MTCVPRAPPNLFIVRTAPKIQRQPCLFIQNASFVTSTTHPNIVSRAREFWQKAKVQHYLMMCTGRGCYSPKEMSRHSFMVLLRRCLAPSVILPKRCISVGGWWHGSVAVACASSSSLKQKSKISHGLSTNHRSNRPPQSNPHNCSADELKIADQPIHDALWWYLINSWPSVGQ